MNRDKSFLNLLTNRLRHQTRHFISRFSLPRPELANRTENPLQAEAPLPWQGQIIANIAEGIQLVRTSDAVIVYTNPAHEHMFGYEPGEMIGQHVSIVNAPTEKDPLETTQEIIDSLKAKGSWQGEVYNIKKDGTLFWCYATVSSIYHPEYGEVWISIHQDITEGKRTQAALQESETRLNLALTASGMGVWEWDVQTNTIFWSPECYQILGVESLSETLDTFVSFLHPEDAACVLAVANQALIERTVYKAEFRIIRPDGEVRWLANLGRGTYHENGKPLRLTGTVQDITERKQSEAALLHSIEEAERAYRQALIYARELKDEIVERRRAQEALTKERNLLRTLIDSLPDYIAIKDVAGRYLLLNQLYADFLGAATPAECIGRTASDFLPAEVAAQIEVDDQTVIQTGQSLINQERVSADQAGNPLWVLVTKVPLREGQGQILGTIGISWDVTQHKRAEQERALYATQLQGLAMVSLAINSFRVLDEILKIVTQQAREIIGAHMAVIRFTLNETLRHVAVSDSYAAWQDYQEAPESFGIYEQVYRTGRPLRLNRLELEIYPLWQNYRQAADRPPPLQGLLAVPLLGRYGQNMGLIQLFDKYQGEFSQNDEAMLVQLAQMTSVAMENTQLFEGVRRAKARLQALSLRLLEVQETERRHLARELHDEVGQVLTGLKLLLDMSTRLPGPETPAYLTEAKGLVNNLLAQVRNLSLDLRPAMLDDLGLLPALLWQFERYTTQTQVQVKFEHTGLDRRFPPELETAAYRLAQEALTNVARHAGVSEVLVRLWADAEALTLQIEDKGRGFDAEASLATTISNGLSGMHERVSLLNGQFSLESALGEGTWLTAILPLAKMETSNQEWSRHDKSYSG